MVQGYIDIEYKRHSHFEIIQALREPRFKSKIQIKIVVNNAEESRLYKWSVPVFKNRF